MVDQKQFYFGHKQKYRYKFQLVVILDGLVSSFIEPFIGWYGN